MDQLLSNIIPTQRIGSDGFNWWVGQIEGTASDEKNNKGGYRFKVRIIGDHPGKKELLDTAELPWATVMMPVTVPFIPGNTGGAHPQLEIGCWVVGFYMDTEKQKPIIMGSIGQTPGATKVFAERTPDTAPFVTAIAQLGGKEGQPTQKETGKNTSTGGLSDGTYDGDENYRVNVPASKVVPLKGKSAEAEDWCQSKAEKCDEDDMMSQMTGIMGEFLNAVQSSGGNIGTYVVNEANGVIQDGVNIARGYVNKAMRVVSEFVAKVKGFIIEKITEAVQKLIQALLAPIESGLSLSPVIEFFQNLLKQLGCSMGDLFDRLAEFLTDLLMSYVQQIYRSIACQVDALVNGIMSKINSLMEDLLGSILGPLSDILGVIAGPLNMIGGAINFVLQLLGINCSGPDRSCSKKAAVCTNGGEKVKDDGDFLDKLLGSIDNLFPSTGADYTQYICDDAYKGNELEFTTIGFTGGIPKIGGKDGIIPDNEIGTDPGDEDDDGGGTPGGGTPGGGTPGDGTKKNKKIVYTINDIVVTEGDFARFTVTRSGYTEISSSVKYKTLKYKGTATENEDYYPDSDILGFAPGETSKVISIRTFVNDGYESPEDFYIRLRKNTPLEKVNNSKIKSQFSKSLGKCTIIEGVRTSPSDPYKPSPTNPFPEFPTTFPEDTTNPGDDTGYPDIDTGGEDGDGDGDGFDDTTNLPIVTGIVVTADRTTCPEGEFITYDITTSNVANGSLYYYTLSGDGITKEDIINSNLTGFFIVNDNKSKVVIGIEDDDVVEDAEVLRFTVNGTGAFADVIILTNDDEDLDDDGEGEIPFDTFVEPVINIDDVITDPTGGIIDIPVDNPGSPWAEPPYVFITGEGIGATATALLDRKGFLTEIRVKTPGFGYKKNLPSDNEKRCIIDSFTLIRPGTGYEEPPTIYVNDRTDVAEAIIDDQGFVIGARVLDRVTVFEEFPKIIIVGGGGYGAKLIPSLACLDTDALVRIGSTKIGTGRYVDCP